jgi:hypothetical protein
MNLPKLPAEPSPFVWGALTGAIALAIVGFTWGGWVTGGTSEKLSLARADEATVSSLVPICVAQFRRSPGAKAHLATLKATESWKQAEYVEKAGWATMPGAASDAEPNRGVVSGCADALIKLVL